MGFVTEFNWVLKLTEKNGLDENSLNDGEEFTFKKDENRVYPIGIPIDLINSRWEALARVIVTRMTVCGGVTSGSFCVLKVYNEEERVFLKQYWKESIESYKNFSRDAEPE